MKYIVITLLILLCSNFIGCQDSLQKYDKHGVSFTISDKLELIEYTVSLNGEKLKPGECSYDFGLVGSSELEFSLSWFKVPKLSEEYNLNLFNDLLEVFRYHPGVTAEIIGSTKREIISNYDVNFADIEVIQDSIVIHGIIAFLYCQSSGRQFGYTVLHKNPKDEMTWFLSSLLCDSVNDKKVINDNYLELFNTPVQSIIIIILTILYFIVASITTFDIRITQAIKQGKDEIPLPQWTAIFHWLLWINWILIFFLNWKYALLIFVIKFILKILPVLEIIGNFLMSPFKKH